MAPSYNCSFGLNFGELFPGTSAATTGKRGKRGKDA